MLGLVTTSPAAPISATSSAIATDSLYSSPMGNARCARISQGLLIQQMARPDMSRVSGNIIHAQILHVTLNSCHRSSSCLMDRKG